MRYPPGSSLSHKMFPGNRDTMTVSVPLPADEDGYLDRACPSDKCKVQFKILGDDWKAKVRDEVVFCPMCRHEQEASDWLTKAQREHLIKHAKAQAMEYVHKQMNEIARDFNSGWSGDSMIKLSMTVNPPTRPIIWPLGAAKLMEQRYTCEICGCRYATVGASFFCPACGHNSILKTFSEKLASQKHTIQNGTAIREVLEKQCGKDAAISAWRHMVEHGLANVVAIFEHYAETQFRSLPNASETKRGAFQRLDEASAHWKQNGIKCYDEMLSASEFRDLKILMQRRHLITHRNGIVDAEYVKRSGDRSLQEGQRITVSERDVLRLIGYVERMGLEITAGIAASSTP